MRTLNQLLITGGLVLCVGGTTFAQSANGQGHAPEPVTIVGPLPVPVTGTVEGSVSISGTPAVTISGIASFIDDADRQAFQATLCVPIGITVCGTGSKTLTVPADVRLVIEYVSTACGLAGPTLGHMRDIALTTTVGGVTAVYHFAPVITDTDQNTISSQTTKIYADASTTISGDARAPGAGSGACSFAISGHTVKP